MKKVIFWVFICCPVLSLAGTLAQVKKNGFLRCGVHTGSIGFAAPDAKRNWKGFDVDICKAVAVAVLKKPKVKYVPLSAQQRFTALQSGEIDMLSRITTFTLQRDTAQGLNFAPTTYYDGQGFMVRKKLKIKNIKGLNGASICVNQGTTTELGLADYFRSNKLKYKVVTFEEVEELIKAFEKGRCDAYTADSSVLSANRLKLKKPNNYKVLPQLISKEPLTVAVRHGDDQWFDIVKWSIYALINAEELKINSKNVRKMKGSKNPAVKRFLGVIAGNGKALGLKEDWAYNIILQVGNYKEIFERNLGAKTPLKLKRGLNKLWTQGGLLYAPPMR